MKKLLLLLLTLIVGVGSSWGKVDQDGNTFTFSSIEKDASATTKDGSGGVSRFSVTIPASADLPFGTIVKLKYIKIGKRDKDLGAYLVLSRVANSEMASSSKENHKDAVDPEFGNRKWEKFIFEDKPLIVGLTYPAYFRAGQAGDATNNGQDLALMSYVDGYQVMAQYSYPDTRIMYYEVQVEKVEDSDIPSANVTANSNWSNLSFNPTLGKYASLNFSSDATLTIDDSDKSLIALHINGGTNQAKFTSDEYTFKSAATYINTPTTISSSNINLGSFIIGGSGSLTIDGTSSNVTVNSAMSSAVAKNTVTFKGSGSNGTSTSYGTVNSTVNSPFNSPVSGHLIYSGGTHSMSLESADANKKFGTGATEDNPTIWIKDGATLNATLKDPCGWNHTADIDGIIRVDEASTLNILTNSDKTIYYSQRLYMQPGAKVCINAGQVDQFRMNGGTGEATAQLYMPASSVSSAVAEIGYSNNGNIFLAKDNVKGVAASIGENSTLKISAPIKGDGRTFKKYGSGTLYITGAVTNTQFGIEAGTLKTSVNLGTNTTLSAGASLVVEGGTTEPLAFTMPATNEGATTITSGVVRIAAGTEGANITVSNGATLQLQVTDLQIKAGYDASAVSGEGNVIFVNSEGTQITDNVSGKVLSPSAPIWSAGAVEAENTTSTAARWTNGVPTSADNEVVVFMVNEDATMTVDNTLTLGSIYVKGTAGKTLTIKSTSSNNISIANMLVSSGIKLDLQSGISISTGIEVESDATMGMTISEDKTISSIISGNGGVEISSSDPSTPRVATFSGANTFKGGLTVNQGITAKTTTSTGFGSYTSGAALDALSTITIKDGAAIDIKGTGDYCYRYIISGTGVNNSGAMYNSGSEIGTSKRQACSITLTGDATINCAATWGLLASGHGATKLELNGHTLTKTGSAALLLVSTSKDVSTSGTLVIAEGSLQTYSSKTCNLPTYDLIIQDGASYTEGADLTVNHIRIPAGVAVSRVSTTTYDGAGTITLGGAISNPASNKYLDSWTGTAKLTGTLTNVDLNKLGNANSTVEFNGASGYLLTGTNTTISTNIKLTDPTSTTNAFSSNNGNGNDVRTFAGKVSGTGTMARTAAGTHQKFVFSGDVSEWTGAFKHTKADTDQYTTVEFKGNATEINAAIAESAESNGKLCVNITNDNPVNINKTISKTTTLELTLSGTGTKTFAANVDATTLVAPASAKIGISGAATTITAGSITTVTALDLVVSDEDLAAIPVDESRTVISCTGANSVETLTLNGAEKYVAVGVTYTAVKNGSNIEIQASVERTTAKGKFGTVCLPYDAEANGADLYTATVEADKVVLTSVSGNEMQAGKPYIYYSTADDGSQTFSKKSGGATVASPANGADGLMGTFTPMTAQVGTYVLQTIGGVQKFRQVEAGSEPTVGAYRCYVAAPARRRYCPRDEHSIGRRCHINRYAQCSHRQRCRNLRPQRSQAGRPTQGSADSKWC